MAAPKKTTKATKASKPASSTTKAARSTGKAKKTAPQHPAYKDMIKDAILQLKERNGSSRPALKKYILKNYNITAPNFESLFNAALKRGVEKDEFVMPKGPSGTVKLQKASKEAAKKEAAKKDTAAKKPATKKAAQKKATTTTAASKKTAAPKKKTAAKKPAAKASAAKVSKPAPAKTTTTKSGRKVKASA